MRHRLEIVMHRNTPLDKKFRKKATKLLLGLQGAGYSSEETIGFILAAVESVYPDVTATLENGTAVVSGDVVTH